MKAIIVISFFLKSTAFSVFAQSNTSNPGSLEAKPKSKKQIYIENYIANFPYKNSDVYEVVKQTHLWDTTGAVPVISPNTISANLKPKIHIDQQSEIKTEQK